MTNRYITQITEEKMQEWCKLCEEELRWSKSYPFRTFNRCAGILSFIVKQDCWNQMLKTVEVKSFLNTLQEKLRQTEWEEKRELSEEEEEDRGTYLEIFAEVFQALEKEGGGSSDPHPLQKDRGGKPPESSSSDMRFRESFSEKLSSQRQCLSSAVD